MLILTVTCCKRQIWSTMLLRYRLKVSHYMGAWRCIMNHSCFPPHPTRLAHSTTLTRPVWNYLQSTLSHCVQSTVNSFRHSFLINAVLWWKSLAHILFTVLSLRIRLARTQAFLPQRLLCAVLQVSNAGVKKPECEASPCPHTSFRSQFAKFITSYRYLNLLYTLVCIGWVHP